MVDIDAWTIFLLRCSWQQYTIAISESIVYFDWIHSSSYDQSSKKSHSVAINSVALLEKSEDPVGIDEWHQLIIHRCFTTISRIAIRMNFSNTWTPKKFISFEQYQHTQIYCIFHHLLTQWKFKISLINQWQLFDRTDSFRFKYRSVSRSSEGQAQWLIHCLEWLWKLQTLVNRSYFSSASVHRHDDVHLHSRHWSKKHCSVENWQTKSIIICLLSIFFKPSLFHA